MLIREKVWKKAEIRLYTGRQSIACLNNEAGRETIVKSNKTFLFLMFQSDGNTEADTVQQKSGRRL